jgi:hypothetical protein
MTLTEKEIEKIKDEETIRIEIWSERGFGHGHCCSCNRRWWWVALVIALAFLCNMIFMGAGRYGRPPMPPAMLGQGRQMMPPPAERHQPPAEAPDRPGKD